MTRKVKPRHVTRALLALVDLIAGVVRLALMVVVIAAGVVFWSLVELAYNLRRMARKESS